MCIDLGSNLKSTQGTIRTFHFQGGLKMTSTISRGLILNKDDSDFVLDR